jgi:4-amino-4-deoxy-L-arabinose transferase-like glycosyltransferase
MNSARWTFARVLAVIALVLGAALYLVGLDALPLQCGNEAMYAYPPIEMLKSGDLLVPRYLHAPFLDKPPLTFWILAGTYRVLGISVFAARLPGVLAALATVAAIAFWVRRRSGDLAAAIAGVALLYSFKFAAFARQFAADAFLTLAVVLAVIALDRAARDERVSDGRIGALAGAALALAFGFKGLIGLVLPAGGVAAGLLFDRARPVRWRRRALIAAGVLVLLLLPWHVEMTRRLGLDFWKYFYWSNQFLRGSTTAFTGHFRGPLFYAILLAWGAFPWILFAPSGLRRRNAGPSAVPAGWFVFGLVFLSLLAMKREVYAMPLFPAAAVLAGEGLARALEAGRRWPRWVWVATAVMAGTAFAAWGRIQSALLRIDVGDANGPALALVILAATALLAGWRPFRPARPFLVALGCGAVFHALLAQELNLARAFDPMPAFGDRVRAGCPAGCEAFRLGIKCTSLDYYAQKEWIDLQEPREIVGRIPSEGGYLVLRSRYEPLLSKLGIRAERVAGRPWLEDNWLSAGLRPDGIPLVDLLLVRLLPPESGEAPKRALPDTPLPRPPAERRTPGS